ncbi:putative 1-acyl-sn-glycerol-3-phosphate acyltransferase 5 [Golovinomyces cichoracearum]|uniref:Putative 1-acyl-sn-glycerol-3-phosphate acyltransferase 5 n=1 Tax=Golovinomyces cichoracearum TaxID=62708 RepID=A0A420ILU2_9PEZI|nr:putative 1-acyl-sn-glycerol-3-phosphate acyltransferase 5 [Golovinomyces cichoracearum]
MSLFIVTRGLIIILPWIIYLCVVDIVLSLLLPASYLFPTLVYDVSSFLAFTNWSWIQTIFELFNKAKITYSGDFLPKDESAIVISNHVSWTDFYMIQALAIRANMLSRCRWFAKIELRWVPFLGWGLWAMGMPMVSRNWIKDKKELGRVFNGITGKLWPTWLISFSEATRYTAQKAEKTRIWCLKNDKPIPQHLLYPRIKGFVATVQHLRKAKHVKSVYDVTIVYSHMNKFQSAPSFMESLALDSLSTHRGYKFHVDVRRFALVDLPETDAELALWLESRWVEKGMFLQNKKMEWDRIATDKMA